MYKFRKYLERFNAGFESVVTNVFVRCAALAISHTLVLIRGFDYISILAYDLFVALVAGDLLCDIRNDLLKRYDEDKKKD